jgi:hypothetical protein
MMDERALRWLLLGAIGSVGLLFTAVFVAGLRRRASEEPGDRIRPSGVELGTGFITVFFDTLGIGSFATTTAIFRAMRLVPDELIPGTLNVGHTIESVLSAFVFINLVPVAPVTLISMVAASALGAWFGSGVVSQLPRDSVSIRHGRRAHGGRDADADESAAPASVWRRGDGTPGRVVDLRRRLQLRARQPDDARHRALRAVRSSSACSA